MPNNTPDDRNDVTEAAPTGAKAGAPPRRGGSRRGFAAMDVRTQREIASKGGHSQGKENNRGNFWHDRERARIAGRKGGEAHGKNRHEQPAGAGEQR
ncbi:MAG: general stress protein [Steroidobacterales bacterium]